MFTMTHVSLEINSDNLRVAMARRNSIVKYGLKSLEPGIVKDGNILDENALGLAISALFDTMDIPRNHVICTLSGMPYLYRTIALPASINDELTASEAITRAARRDMQIDEDDFSTTWQKTDARLDENDFFVLGIRKTVLEQLLQSLEIARIKPEVVDLKPLCLARIAGQENGLIASIERDFFEVLIIKDGLLKAIHSFSPHRESKTSEELANEFTDGLLRAIRAYNSEFPREALPTDIALHISGEMTANDEFIDLLTETSNFPVTVISTPLKTSIEAPMAVYSDCFGALMRFHPHLVERSSTFKASNISIDILDTTREIHVAQRWPAYVAAGLGCAAMIVAAYFVFSFQNEKRADADLLELRIPVLNKQLNSTQQEIRAAQAALTTHQSEVDKLQNEITLMQSDYQAIFNQQHTFSSDLVYINDALPDEVFLDSVTLDGSTIAISGHASISFYILDFTDALESGGKYPEAVILTINPVETPPTTEGDVTFTISIEGLGPNENQ